MPNEIDAGCCTVQTGVIDSKLRATLLANDV